MNREKMTELMQAVLTLEPGSYLVLPLDEEIKTVKEKPTFDAIYKAIPCEVCDTVTLQYDPAIVMLVDDLGAINDLPINKMASALYLARCKPGTSHRIHGVAIVCRDEDFA